MFAGVGGGILADLILGHEPVLAVELVPWRCEVLRGNFPGLHVHCGDVGGFDWSPWVGRVDQISAGFPCQDISTAGRGAGLGGERSGLYWEVVRAIDAVRPRWVFLENSPAIRTRGRREVVGSLVARGYAWRDGVLSASDVGAPHLRRRWWLLADADQVGLGGVGERLPGEAGRRGPADCAADADGERELEPGGGFGEVRGRSGDCAADAGGDGLEEPLFPGWVCEADGDTIQAAARHTGRRHWNPPADSDVRGVVHGVPSRVDAISALGDAQVPLCAAAAWLTLRWS